MARRISLAFLFLLGGFRPVAAAPLCVGDCDAAGTVTINELIKGVSIALGGTAVAECTRMDANSDGTVAVNEVVAAVNNALNGCPDFIGQYFGTVQLDGGRSATLLLTTQANGQATGQVTILDGSGALASVTGGAGGVPINMVVTGTIDLDTGVYSVAGSYMEDGETIPISADGTLPLQPGSQGTFNFHIGTQVFAGSITAGDGSTPTPTPTRPAATATPTQSGPTPTPTFTATPGPATQRIVFAGGVLEIGIWVINTDGTGKTRIHQPPVGIDANPVWSPDGARVAFATPDEQNDHVTIGIVNADGGGFHRLAEDTAFLDGNPAWSPDGSRIVFTAGGGDHIEVMNADGSGRQRLVSRTESEQFGPLSWSPDGTRIAFEAEPDSGSKPEIFVMNADGSNRVRLTNNTVPDQHPDWSPDGSRVLFVRLNTPQGGIMTIRPDGSGETRLLLDAFGVMNSPNWSRDGNSLAYASLLGITITNASGAGATSVPGTSSIADFDYK